MGRGPFEWAEDFQRLGERVDDFVERVFELASMPRYDLQQTWRPNVDVYRLSDGIAVVVELPGVDEADLKVIAEPGRLRIAGNRPARTAGPGAEPLQLEIDYGPFERVVALPPGADADHVTAEFRTGLLTVRVPIREQRHNVRVQSDSTSD